MPLYRLGDKFDLGSGQLDITALEAYLRGRDTSNEKVEPELSRNIEVERGKDQTCSSHYTLLGQTA